VPQPSDRRLADIYGVAYYEPWQWERKETVQAGKALTFTRALALANPRRGQRLLDVGCAQGELAAAASRMGLTVLGVDINAEAIGRAREQVPEATFYCGELDPDAVGSSWDLVTMFDFIEHVRCPRDTLARARSVLAPDGCLILSTPRTGSLAHRVGGTLWPQYREEHLVLFSASGLKCVLDDAGFEVRAVKPTTKFVSGAYLLGQLAAYSPPAAQKLARHLQWTLRVRPMHAPVPLRFGEMTVVAQRKAGAA
jgi:2-polyprenyl-3-methyl-5-hydroxy-6-metoxy-1,4-benzoquinol methylase